MKKEKTIWWVNHLFNVHKELLLNKGLIEEAREVEAAQDAAIDSINRRLTADGDLVYRADVIEAFPRITLADIGFATKAEYRAEAIENINTLPSAEAVSFEDAMQICNTILFKEYMRGRRDAETVHNDGRNNIKRYPNCQMRTSLGNCDAIGGFCTSVNEAICDAFHKLAEAAQDWTPCSKGLPKYRETVFLTKRDGNVDIGWRDGIKEDGTDDWFELVLGGATCAIWNITAWMPRPEPYKGGDSE